MKKLVLHIGAPKSASSTIQSYLSTQFSDKKAKMSLSGEPLRYMAFTPNGEIRSGKHIKDVATSSAFGYVASAPFLKLECSVKDIIEKISRNTSDQDTVIMSCEGWGATVRFKDKFSQVKQEFEDSGIPLEIFFVVRPPVDWVNSAWWQWGAWAKNVNFRQWTTTTIGNFFAQAQAWRSISTVSKIQVCDISQNPLMQLQKFLNVEETDFEPNNVGTHPALLKVLLNGKQKFGRTVHTPAIEFELVKKLNLPKRALPFVLTKPIQKEIIDQTRDQVIKLIKLVEETTGEMTEEAKAKYLDVNSYSDRPVRNHKDISTPEEDLELMTKLLEMVAFPKKGQPESVFAAFDPKKYLRLNSDVREAGVNPYEHFFKFGMKEGRKF